MHDVNSPAWPCQGACTYEKSGGQESKTLMQRHRHMMKTSKVTRILALVPLTYFYL